MTKFLTKSAGCVVLFWLVSASQQLFGGVIYANTNNDLNLRFNPGTYQVGNEINVLGGFPHLTGFSFEYWGTNTASPTSFAGSIQAEVRFYLNDGTQFNGYATPGTMFYDSGLFAVSTPTSRSTFVFDESDFYGGSIFIPGGATSFTWTVQFSGMGATDSVGLDIYGPPGVGSDFSDYWENQGSGWALKTNSLSSTMSFGSLVTADVPEPSSLALSILGGLGFFVFLGRLRRKE
jgi:hypothetical protein